MVILKVSKKKEIKKAMSGLLIQLSNYNISVQIGNYEAVQDTFIKDDTIHYMNHCS